MILVYYTKNPSSFNTQVEHKETRTLDENKMNYSNFDVILVGW